MAKTVKMQDIAEKLGVSTMTVSKALAGKPGVSQSMRKKIRNLADEMGYVVPGSEKGEYSKSYNIGVILAEYYTEKYAASYWKLYHAVSNSAVKRNCFVMLEVISEEEEKTLVQPRLIQEKKIDGLLILGGMERGYLKMISGENSIPIVYVDFYDNCVNEDSVISNSFYGAYQITNYLFEKGHRRIGFVGTLFASKSITDKYLGYEKAVIEHGEKIRDDWIIPDREYARSNYEKLTIPCNQTNYTTGNHVPEDISVVGYDAFLYPGLCNIGITTYGVDMNHMAETTIRVILSRIVGNDCRKGIHVVEGYVIEKESVRQILD